MSLQTLANNLFALPSTITALDTIDKYLITMQFENLASDLKEIPVLDNGKLVTWASIFAKSADSMHRRAALRISHYLLVTNQDKCSNIPQAAAIILDRLQLEPTLDLSIKKELLAKNFHSQLPFSFKMERYISKVSNSFILPDGNTVVLNGFQKDLLENINEYDCISVSAPTSAGKSFIIMRWIEHAIYQSNKINIAYIVPTRALIQQVQMDLAEYLKKSNVNITSVPIIYPQASKNVYVLTQERLHMLMHSSQNRCDFGLIVIDEAQKIAEGSRGVLLEQTIQDTIDFTSATEADTTQTIFLAPMINNPELLLDTVQSCKSKTSIISDYVTVNQNVLWTSQKKRHPLIWQLYKSSENGIEILGEYNLSEKPSSQLKKLALVSHSLSKNIDGNLIYVNGQADAEKAARYLKDLVAKNQKKKAKKELNELSALVKNTIHAQYSLRTALQYGIAFHYGNMPLLIRNEIEELFKQGIITYLVCTSTLVEGVNLPARNIFVCKPSKGRSKPLANADFWNLAGRAGRLGKEYQGNIVCVDPTKWDAPTHRQSYSVERASIKVISNTALMIECLKSNADIDGMHLDEAEHSLSYLLSNYYKYGNISKSPQLKTIFTKEQLCELQSVVDEALDAIHIPKSIIEKNPGVTPRKMQHMYNYIQDKVQNQNRDVYDFIPVDPYSDDATAAYNALIQRLAEQLIWRNESKSRCWYLAILAVNWMRGYPLSRLISEWIKYLDSKNRDYKLAEEIRRIMTDVETFVRFKFMKYISCYVDILKHFLITTGKEALISEIPDIGLWVEFGASQNTQISLMGIGLSRISALAIADKIIHSDLSVDDVRKWLFENDIKELGLSPIIEREVARILGNDTTMI